MIWRLTPENLTFLYANNKVADQLAHLHSLNNAFLFSPCKVSYLGLLLAYFQLVFVADQTEFSLTKANFLFLVVRVTQPYLNLLVKPRIFFFRFTGKYIIL